MYILQFSIFLSTSFANGIPVKQPTSPNTSCEQAINKAQINKESTANDLNTYGMRCYKEKRFDDAATLFQKAIRLDKNHVLANYNYACMLSLLLTTRGPCDMDQSWESAFGYLHQS